MDPSFIKRFDVNGDKKVSRRELPVAKDLFDRLDKTGDGYISKSDR